jgi:hypothetical protein
MRVRRAFFDRILHLRMPVVSHACSLEASIRVTNGNLLGWSHSYPLDPLDPLDPSCKFGSNTEGQLPPNRCHAVEISCGGWQIQHVHPLQCLEYVVVALLLEAGGSALERCDGRSMRAVGGCTCDVFSVTEHMG